MPEPGEQSDDVLADWRRAALELDALWSEVDVGAWRLIVREPQDNPDLGDVPLSRFALARLTETDVHGVDLGIGFPDWSDTLIEVGLPVRLGWLATRRANHRAFDRTIRGTWRLESENGFSWTITVDGERVESAPTSPRSAAPTATLCASERDLLALLLGRPPSGAVTVAGDVDFGRSFNAAFPGP